MAISAGFQLTTLPYVGVLLVVLALGLTLWSASIQRGASLAMTPSE
jgi:DHA1 family inner membrane transport protein